MYDIRQLRHFVAVAEEKHFRIASERLHMTQPPLSISIKKLEESLGVTLLDRSNKQVDLTPAGEVFLAGAYEALAKIEQISSDAKRAADGLVGRLNIGFAGSAIYDALPSTVRVFREHYPDVELEMVEMSTLDQLDAISNGKIDAGFLRPPITGSGLYHLQTVQEENLIVVMPESHPLAEVISIDLSDLVDDGFIVFPQKTSPNLHALVLLACHGAGFSPQISQTAHQIQTQISLVSAGLGVALVPECVKKAAHQGVVYKNIKNQMGSIKTVMSLASRQGQNSKFLSAFINICREMNSSGYFSQNAVFHPFLPAR